MLEAFDRFKGQIDAAYARARQMLDAGDYEGCHTVLAHIAQSHAKTSTSMRNVAIRRGKMKGDE
jgi:hypothetical protein